MLKSVKEVKDLGFNPSKTTFGAALIAKTFVHKTLWKEKVDALKKWGWSEEDSLEAFRKKPYWVSGTTPLGVVGYLKRLGYVCMRRYTLPRMQPRSLTPSHAYIEWLTTVCNPRLRISIDTKPSDSDPDEEEEAEHKPEIHTNQTPIHYIFGIKTFFSQLQDHQSQPHTTQKIHGSVTYEFLDTLQQNIIQQPPYTSPRNAYEPHYQSTYQQNSLPNYGYNDPNQASTSNSNYFSYNDPNQAGPSNTNYPPYNNPQYPMYTNQNYNHPPTPTNLLSQFSPASLDSNE
ncbi:hypothetical protein MTR_2g436380 [Medicago truncatula]|uniref:Uncharacterized protein n=1 Tax=Medicago truncatula TaxID=3880 RepID=A0A072VGD4_MEDTR|nr:hypothetical protein MTR_2g436380 [Medicago truncatula]